MIETIEEAQRSLTEATMDVRMDMGERAVEAAWRDIVYSVADRCTTEVGEELIRRNLSH